MANETKKVEVEEPQVQEEVQVVEQPKIKKVKTTSKGDWEIKDRVYVLNDIAPLGYHLQSTGLFWFDEEKGYEREIAYSRNQTTVFKDAMRGDVRPQHVWFRDGMLHVGKDLVMLQKFLSIYHPQRNKVYRELDEEVVAMNQVDSIELELTAMNLAKSMTIDEAEAVMRVEIGSRVSNISSKELRRDLLIFSKKNPKLFIDIANDDSIHLRNIGIKATEMGILKLSEDQRTFNWGSNDRKILNVPFDEHPYSALAAWFKTDEGMEVLQSIEKRLNS